MLSFLHGGDFHLDAPFHSLAPSEAKAAREAQRRMLRQLVAVAKETGAEVLFLTRDIFDSARIYPETLDELSKTFEALAIPVFLSPGNHDPYTDHSPYRSYAFPKNVYIFSTPQCKAVSVPTLDLTVYGSAFVESQRLSSPMEGFVRSRQEGLHIGCFHGDFAPSTYGPLTREDVAASGLDYLALGHVHKRSDLQFCGSVPYAYSGPPQGRGFDETGQQGIYFGQLEKGAAPQLRFIPLSIWQYHDIPLSLDGRSAKEALAALLPPRPTPDMLRLTLVGERSEADISLPALYELAGPSFAQLIIRDETHPAYPLWDRALEDNLRGYYLREMKHCMDQANPEESAHFDRSLRFGLAALEGRESPL